MKPASKSPQLGPKERKRLVKEARKLAYECAEGTAPEFGVSREFNENGTPSCASGHICHRAKVPQDTSYDLASPIRHLLPRGEREVWWTVADANDGAAGQIDRQERLVFPLLDLADALEAL